MLNETGSDRVYLACGPTDMRKSIDGLAALVQEAYTLDPFSCAWYVFCNKDRDKLKVLRWDHNGFWLYYRRLERGRFHWPRRSEEAVQLVTRRQLQWLLDGLNLEQRKAHQEVRATRVI